MLPTVQTMWKSWLIVGTLVLICAVIALRTGGVPRINKALASGGGLFLSVLPNLILGFLFAGFLHVLLPTELVSAWMGHESGLKGLLVGTLAG
ncbi:MAG: hypothetical protein HYY57_02950, partial [Candidatus Omnitrophica bacterium]|nr:hypothetical protein [Candidatus Omnitrophota bacterium]